MVSLKTFKPLGRIMRMDRELSELGVSTWDHIRECIKKGDTELALKLVDYLRTECKGIHDASVDVWYALVDWIARSHGEEDLPQAYRHAKSVLDKTLFTSYASMSLEDLVRWYTEPMRGHFSGPKEEGNFKVYEEEDRYVM